MSQNTDVPALSGAAIAGTVSVFMGSGSYGVISAIISLTLMVFLKTYSWHAADTKEKQVVYSMVFALVALPFVATILEAIFYCSPFIGMVWESSCLVEFGRQPGTWVTDTHIAFSWVAIFIIVFLVRRYQKAS
ncbi:hypothetical protein [Vibrio paucivorans]